MGGEEKFNCFLIGGQSLLIRCAELLLSRGHELSGVISRDPAVKAWAGEKNILFISFDAGYEERLKSQ